MISAGDLVSFNFDRTICMYIYLCYAPREDVSFIPGVAYVDDAHVHVMWDLRNNRIAWASSMNCARVLVTAPRAA